jgi:hypothetical protein
MKKQHLVVGAIIGGLLLAATMHNTRTFALSDSTSGSTDPSTTTTGPTTTSPTTNTTTTPTTGAVAGGSTATQTAGNSVASTQTTGASTTTTAPTTGTTTDPSTSQTAGTNNTSPTTPTNPQTTGGSSTTSTNTTAGNTAQVDNTLKSGAQSGNATVSNNNVGGSATTGNASGVATLVNAIASATNLGSGGLQTFTLNLNGTQNGNVVLNPNQLLGGSLIDPVSNSGQNNVGGQNNSTINNNVNLSATSGNATVSNNRKAGNATTGNATTEADIVNLIESLITDKKAFLGVININGTLNGNILLPASVINQLLKGQGGLSSSNLNAANNITVNNNVSLSAQSGTASDINNAHGGNATSGNATTKLNIYNLLNSQIVGGNVLLVFVNVMGNWYGLLMNAPAGTTSAALGGGISQYSQGDTSVPASQIFGVNNETINNNVTLASKTGNATVSGNHRGGNATTGNATAIADIVNILGAQINLSGWLGILIINVFGTWNGSLEIQQPTTTTHHHQSSGSKPHNSPNRAGDGFAYYINYNPIDPAPAVSTVHVLGDTINNGLNSSKHVAVVFDHTKNSNVFSDMLIAGFTATIAGAAGAAKYLSARRKKL